MSKNNDGKENNTSEKIADIKDKITLQNTRETNDIWHKIKMIEQNDDFARAILYEFAKT